MKQAMIAITALGLVFSTAAKADNASVEKALSSRGDLSDFYQALVNTGVIHELEPNRTYTIFAPTNKAFNSVPNTQYPCFYSSACKEEVAQVLRNHIVPGDVYLGRANGPSMGHEGDTVAKNGVYSINNRFVAIGTQNIDNVAVDGHNILYTTAFSGGMLYKIDGVIVNNRELTAFMEPYGEQATTTTYRHVVNDPNCALPEGCTDRVSQTTTIRTTAPVVTRW